MTDKKLLWYVGGEDIHLRIPILQRLIQRGFSVAALGSEPADVFDKLGLEYHQYPLERGLAPFADISTKSVLKRLFQRGQPALVHGFDTKPAIYAPVCAAKAGIKSAVRTITGMGHVFSSDRLIAKGLRPVYRYLQRQASNAAAMTIFQNSDDYNYFLSHKMVNSDRATIVKGSGIDVDSFTAQLPRQKDAEDFKNKLELNGQRVVTLVTRVVREKGVVEFLEAAQIVCREIDDVAFLLIGPCNEGNWQAVPQAEIDSLTNRRIRYLGQRDDVSSILAISDIFVLPSYYREGVPRVLLEAGAAGLPLVATDMPGCRDVVRDSWNGRLVPPRDSAQLAGSLIEILKEPGDALRIMGENSHQHIRRHFELSMVVDAYTGIYERLLNSTGAPGKD